MPESRNHCRKREATIAGFEMGYDIYIATALPEDTAACMREIAASYLGDVCISFREYPAGYVLVSCLGNMNY